MTYRVFLTELARDALNDIESNARSQIIGKLRDLHEEPEKRGKPLVAELAGYRSIRAAGRYRIIYRVENDTVRVVVVYLGMRKEGAKDDAYALAKKLLRAGLLR